jgi:hypothetical protein
MREPAPPQEKITYSQVKLLSQIAAEAAEAADKALIDYFAGTTVSELAARKQEEIEYTCGYFSGYRGPMSLVKQCHTLRKLFPHIGDPNVELLAQINKGSVPLTEGAEGWFAIPNVWGNIETFRRFGGTDSHALQSVLQKLQQTRGGKFLCYCDGEIDSDHCKQSERSEEFFIALSEAQGHPRILIVDAQFGIRHRGRSVRRAREVFGSNEVGLGAFAIGIMLLTHPQRLQNVNDLWLDCAGDEFKPKGGRVFSHAPCFVFWEGSLGLGTGWIEGPSADCGAPSAFRSWCI